MSVIMLFGDSQASHCTKKQNWFFCELAAKKYI